MIDQEKFNKCVDDEQAKWERHEQRLKEYAERKAREILASYATVREVIAILSAIPEEHQDKLVTTNCGEYFVALKDEKPDVYESTVDIGGYRPD